MMLHDFPHAKFDKRNEVVQVLDLNLFEYAIFITPR